MPKSLPIAMHMTGRVGVDSTIPKEGSTRNGWSMDRNLLSTQKPHLQDVWNDGCTNYHHKLDMHGVLTLGDLSNTRNLSCSK